MLAVLLRKAGFTIIELLLVLGILAILVAVAAPYVVSTIGRNELSAATWEVVGTLRQAQTQARTSYGNTAWGVHVEPTQIVLFEGITYNAADPDNIVTLVTGSVSITGITLNGGGADIRFTKNKGETTDYGTITLTDASSGETAAVVVSATGVVTQN